MEIKNKREITLDISDLKEIIEQYIRNKEEKDILSIDPIEFIVDEESVFTCNTDGYTDYIFKGAKVMVNYD